VAPAGRVPSRAEGERRGGPECLWQGRKHAWRSADGAPAIDSWGHARLTHAQGSLRAAASSAATLRVPAGCLPCCQPRRPSCPLCEQPAVVSI